MHIGLRASLAGYALLFPLLVGGCRTAANRLKVADARPVSSLDSGEERTMPHTVAESQWNHIEAAAPLEAPEIGSSDIADVEPVSFDAPTIEEIAAPGDDLPTTLEVDALVAEVLAVNPDIRAAVAAWRAAAQRFPQVVALDDPMVGYMLGPDSWGSSDVKDAYMVEASQKLPWPGKRQLRGNIARAEANAAYYDVGEQRLTIAEATRLAYFRYFLAHRQLAVLADSTSLLRDFRQIAKSRYESGEVEQQDVLLADVELADQERRLLELSRQEQVARARINTLLLVTADAPLPPPPADLSTPARLPGADELRTMAISRRPELAAQAARIRAEQYSISLADKEFYPDLEVVARYDAFWQEEALRPMVGMNLNLPLYKQKRYGAVAEARARIAEQQADLDSKVNEINFEVERAYREVEESRQSIAVYQNVILPTVRHSIDAARASYLSGRLDFLRLVESQRQYLDKQDEYYAKVAAYQQQLASLGRLVGDIPGLTSTDN